MKRMRVLTLGAIVLGSALVGLAGPASAHVTVNSPGATQGGYTVLTFRVPTESATASTTKLQVQFPTDTPIASILVQPHPGWSFQAITTKLPTPITTDDGDAITEAVTEIDWTADSADDAIKPGEFDQFLVSAGPLPNVSVLQFSAIQYYSDNSVVKWNQVAAPGTAAPDHPKPSLTLAKAGTNATATTAATADKGGSDTGAVVLSIIALVVAAAALGLGVLSRARSGRTQ